MFGLGSDKELNRSCPGQKCREGHAGVENSMCGAAGGYRPPSQVERAYKDVSDVGSGHKASRRGQLAV